MASSSSEKATLFFVGGHFSRKPLEILLLITLVESTVGIAKSIWPPAKEKVAGSNLGVGENFSLFFAKITNLRLGELDTSYRYTS